MVGQSARSIAAKLTEMGDRCPARWCLELQDRAAGDGAPGPIGTARCGRKNPCGLTNPILAGIRGRGVSRKWGGGQSV